MILSWRIRSSWCRYLSWTAITFFTLAVLLAVLLNWQGSRAWQRAHARLVAEAEDKTFDQYIPPPPPEELNFFAIPALRELTLVIGGDRNAGTPAEARRKFEQLAPITSKARYDALPQMDGSMDFAGTSLPRIRDYLYLAACLPVPSDSGNEGLDVLAALDATRPLMKEMLAAVDRPQAQFCRERHRLRLSLVQPGGWQSPIRGVCDVANAFALRARAAQAAGDAKQAINCLRVCFRVAQAVSAEPCAIGACAATAVVAIACKQIGKLASSHALTEVDLATLDTELRAMDARNWVLRGQRQQMTMELETFDLIESTLPWCRTAEWHRYATEVNPTKYTLKTTWNLRIAKFAIDGAAACKGFWRHSKAETTHQWLDTFIKPLRKEPFDNWKSLNASLEAEVVDTLPALLLPSRASVAMNKRLLADAITAEFIRQQTLVIIALERHRAVHNDYPDSLSDILPGNAPAHYTRRNSGNYQLMIAGPDGELDSLDDLRFEMPPS